MQYIHYGSDSFDINRFIHPHNVDYKFFTNKPIGGLWASPLNGEENGWIDWCQANDYEPKNGFSESFIFELKPDSKVLRLETPEDIKYGERLGVIFESEPHNLWGYGIDFETLMKLRYVAVEAFLNPFIYMTLYGWDCDSLLVLNPECMIFEE